MMQRAIPLTEYHALSTESGSFKVLSISGYFVGANGLLPPFLESVLPNWSFTIRSSTDGYIASNKGRKMALETEGTFEPVSKGYVSQFMGIR